MQENYRPAPGEDGTHTSFCRLCEALCGLSVEVEAGRITRIGPDRDHPVSEGHLCIKGARMVDIVHDADRVLHPLRRKGGAGDFERVSWDEALDDIAARLGTILGQHGRDSLAVYLGNPASFASMHPAYMGGFLRTLGSGRKFNSLHTDTGAKNLAMELTYGNPFRYTFPDLEDCDFLIVIGGNPVTSHMSLVSEPRVLARLDAIAARGGVVVIDPRRTETAQRYEHLPVRPNSDVWLLVTMLNTLFEEGLFDPEALDAIATGWRDLRSALAGIPAETAAARCGVSVEDTQALARRLAAARTAAVYTRLGTGRGSFATLSNLLIEAINIVTGRLGQSGGWVIGEGAVPAVTVNPFPYGGKRSRIGDLPLILDIAPGGTLASEITTPGAGQIRALFVDSGNPVMSYPRGDRLEQALEMLDLHVSFDLYVNETDRFADYVLPATTFLERPDMNELWGANAPRPWIQYTDAVLNPQGEARNEFDIYAAILERMGLPSPLAMMGTTDCPNPDPIAAVDAKLQAGPFGASKLAGGLSLAMLRDHHPHGYRFQQRVDPAASLAAITLPGGKANLWGEVYASEFVRLLAIQAPAKPDDAALLLFGRRRLQSLNSWMHNSERLTRGHQPCLQIHPADAARLELADGQRVAMITAAGRIVVPLEVTEDIVPGAVCYPHGWGNRGGWQRANAIEGANVNLLASDDPADWEQVSGMCLLDGIPVRLEPA